MFYRVFLLVRYEKKQIALLVYRPGFTRLAVWDWEKNRELFSKELSDRPIQFDYSGKGNYLFTTRIKRKIDLGVVCIKVCSETMVSDYSSQRLLVIKKDFRSQNRTLGHIARKNMHCALNLHNNTKTC